MTNVENSYSNLKFFSALLFCSSKQADPYFLSEEREEILSVSRAERVLFFSIHSESENSGGRVIILFTTSS